MYKATITIEVEGEDLMSVKNVTGLIDARLNNSCMKGVNSCDIEVTYEKDGEYVDRDEREIEV